MKRKTYRATVIDAAGHILAERDAYAWNSGIRASEALVRKLALERGAAYWGQSPAVEGEGPERTYSRTWMGGDGLAVWATVREPVSA